MLSKLYRCWLTAAGYRPEWSERQHPLSTHKPRPGRTPIDIQRREHRQAILQAHVHLHRDRLHPLEPLKREGRELACALEEIRLRERHAEDKLNSVISELVDLVEYRLGYR